MEWLPRSISPLLVVELVLVRDDIFANDWPLNVVTTVTKCLLRSKGKGSDKN